MVRLGEQEAPARAPDHRGWVIPAAVGWALFYAAYRGYYAAGGQWLMTGTLRPGRQSTFQGINLVAVLVLLAAAALPLVLRPLWARPRPCRALLVLCWLIAVGCTMHATVDIIQRALSLGGHLTVDYPASLWQSVDRRSADLQDLAFNEPWFLIEGLLFAALAHPHLPPGTRRRYYLAALLTTLALTGYGLLAAIHAVPTLTFL